MGDLGVPTISCLIGTQKFDQALCDLRASVSIVTKVIYDQLNHDSFVPTSMNLQLVDSIDPVSNGNCGRYPDEKFFHTSGLHGTRNGCLLSDTDHFWRPLLSTAGATIDVEASIIKLNISGNIKLNIS
jgi:hypothetical protein